MGTPAIKFDGFMVFYKMRLGLPVVLVGFLRRRCVKFFVN